MAIAPPRDLTLPAQGSTTARAVLGAYLKEQVRSLFGIPMGRFDASVFDDFADLRADLQRLLKSEQRGAVFSVIRRPAISVLIRCIDRELYGDGDVRKLDAYLGELTATIGLELARIHGLADKTRQARRPGHRVLCPGGGFALHLDAGVELGFRNGRLLSRLEAKTHQWPLEELAVLGPGNIGAGLSLTFPFAAFASELKLSWVDNNPLSLDEAHPEKSGNAIDLGGRDPQVWLDALSEAFALIEAHLPTIAAEMQLVMQYYHPVGFDAERHLSASYAEAIGAAYVSLHPDPLTLAEALIHEFCHNKINALFALDAVLKNAFSPLFTSPIRPDPRPLYGVLLAVHAFVPVSELHAQLAAVAHPLSQADPFIQRRASVIRKNLDGIATLQEHADPTPVGSAIVAELSAWASQQHTTKPQRS